MKRSPIARGKPLVRGGPMGQKPLRKKAKAKTSGAYRNQATEAWSRYIHARDKCCQVCGKSDGVLHAHHMMVRSFNATRTDEGNGVLCCFRCHRYFFHGTDPHKVVCWYSNYLGIDGYKALRQKAYDGINDRFGVDYWRNEKERLTKLLEALGDG